MKGIVFTLLNELIEEKFGIEIWDEVVTENNLSSEGAYTSGDTYPESEFKKILKSLSKKTNISEVDLIHLFGQRMFHKLAERYPELVPNNLSLKNFLKTIDGIIHVEVLKLHPTAELPRFKYEDNAANELIMNYQSPRKLCALATGLILGSAEHYHEKVTISQPVCMLEGADHCELKIKFLGTELNPREERTS